MVSTILDSPLTPGSLLAPLADNEYLVDLIAELTGAEAAGVRAKLAQEHQRLGSAVDEDLKKWGLEPYTWSDRLEEFYEKTDAFLYETLVWNRTEMKHEMRRSTAAFLNAGSKGPLRVLVFGDGLGIDSLYLAESGHSVDYYEVSERCIRFAKRLSEKLERDISIVSSPEDVALESYDAVVCLDVLEHVSNPPEVVALLTSFLRPGGRLIVHAPFWYIHRNVSTHLRSNLKYSGELSELYRAHGLQPVAAELFWNPLLLEKTAPGIRGTMGTGASRAKVALGGLLLKSARLFRWPHLLAFQWMFRHDRSKLRRLAADLVARQN